MKIGRRIHERKVRTQSWDQRNLAQISNREIGYSAA